MTLVVWILKIVVLDILGNMLSNCRSGKLSTYWYIKELTQFV